MIDPLVDIDGTIRMPSAQSINTTLTSNRSRTTSHQARNSGKLDISRPQSNPLAQRRQ